MTGSGIPEQIGPYRIKKALGRGGMGVVYLARDGELDRDVAIKALPPQNATEREWLDQLVLEARALGRLNHPNVAQIYSMEFFAGSRYLVIEYVPGESLRERLRKGPLRLEAALTVIAQVAAGLEAAHNRNVVHRDLKPENVRIRPDGVTKVIDFGLALSRGRSLEESADSGASRSTARTLGAIRGTIVQPPERFRVAGTPGYMSPEQIRGRPTDKRSDIFSFGCVFYECLSGVPAFGGENAMACLDAVLVEDPDWTRIPASTPVSIRSLVGHCLEKDLGRRLGDLAEARLEIEDLLEKPKPHQPPVASIERVPNNIPAEVSSFIGREAVIEKLVVALRSNRILTLTGAGGCGKTRLARRLASEALSFSPDGVWMVELAGIRDRSVVSETLAASVAPRTSADTDEATSLGERIGDARMLLVLDNCEHLVGICRENVDSLLRACRNLRVLVTSQEVLGLPGESVFSVPSLSLPGLTEEPDPQELLQYESVKLFVDRARLVRPGFALTPRNAQIVGRICRRLDGIPLAIELAAARVKILSVQQIESHLDDRFHLLTGGSPLALERQRTLLATVDWSYGLLAEDEQRLLRELSVFSDGWTLWGAAAVCWGERGELEMVDCMTRLVEKSLIFLDETTAPGEEPRYRMLETMREYAQKKLSGTRDAEIRNRHFDLFLALGERAHDRVREMDDASWLRVMTSERSNLMEALRWSLATDDGTGHDLRLARVLRDIWPDLWAGTSAGRVRPSTS